MKRILLLCMLMASGSCFANRIYVNPLATDTSDGTSWARAYKKLQSGLDMAHTGDTVLVAEGVYTNLGYSGIYCYRLYKGITVLGGYPNTGNPTDAQRNWANHPTILNGGPGINGTSDNTLLIQNITDPVVIDGFVMTNSSTFGVRIENSATVVIKNTLFQNNYNQLVSVSNSPATLINCVFYNNSGFAVYNTTNANTSLYNCVMVNNNGYAGVIKNQDALLSMNNCTLVNNTGVAVSGTGTGATVVTNCIFWNNRIGSQFENADIQSDNQSIQISHCITQTYYNDNINTLLVNQHPRFLNEQQPAGADNKFFTADDGLQLTVPCSPALNYGDNSVLGSITTDIIGNPRIYNGGTVDLGAYEMQQTPGAHLTTVYVNGSTGNTGTHDGSSWANAYTTLQQALLYCADTIKIAEGTYLTGNSYMDSVFSIESGKVILGGYPATGNPSNADRDPRLHRTILKGNYATSSTGRYSPVIKAYHTDSTTLLDGIMVTNWATNSSANAYAVAIDYKSKLKIRNCDFRIDAAQGIRVTGLSIKGASTPSIYRCTFNTGYSENGGYAIGCATNSRATIAWCNFRAYTAEGGGVAVSDAWASLDSCTFWQEAADKEAVFISSSTGTLAITNCLFRASSYQTPLMHNDAHTTGTITNSVFRNISVFINAPVIYNDNSHLIFNKCLFDSSTLVMRNTNYSSPVLNNCVSLDGRFMWNQRSAPIVNNCTVVNNYFPPQTLGNLARQELVINEDSSVFRANNTIFWSAKLSPGIKDISDQVRFPPQASSISILTNCLTQNYGTDGQNGNIVGKVPRFYRLDRILGADNKLFTDDDGLQLAPCSPAVNAGNDAIGTILSTDVLNNPRIAQGVIDIGAYELQQPARNAGTYYVNGAATGNNTGTSWTDAYPDLQSALCNACADVIRVAAGTYKPAISNRDSTFAINRPLALYGGYPETGSAAETDRDAVKHPTILSGNIGNPADSLDNSPVVVFVNGVTDSVYIDGFVMRDAYNGATFGANVEGGGGLYVMYSNAGIRNCRFINNHAFPYGGGISIGANSQSTVDGCIFTGNSASNSGGALYSNGNLRLTGCVFDNNYAAGNGGAVYVTSRFDINNSIFYRNYTTFTTSFGVGGGLYAATGMGNVYNCSFVGNKATYKLGRGGGGLYSNQTLSVQINNCIFSGNMTDSAIRSNGADLDWQASYDLVHNCILQYDRMYPLPAWQNQTTEAGFEDVSNPKGADGIWLTHDDGLQLHFSSAAINHGRNAFVQNLPVDVLGDARIVLDTVDVGAYEYQNRPVAHAGNDTLICTGNTAKIGGENNPRFTYNWTSSPTGFTSASAAPVVNPSVPTAYFLEVSNGTEMAYDTIQVSMSNSLTPSVSVATPSTSVCAGTPTLFTAIPVYGGTNPSYEWQVNGAKAGTDTAVFSAALQNNDQVRVVLTSSASCASSATATSNVVTMNVTPVAIPQVTVDGPVSFCPGDTVTYTATVFDGGQRPLFKWVKGGLVVATTYDNTYTTNTITGQTNIYAMMFSNAVCETKPGDTSNVLAIVPKQTVTPSVTVSASGAIMCGAQPVTFTAQAYGGGTSPLWQWKINGNNAGANSNVYKSNSLMNGDKVYVVMTSNAECPTPPTVESNKVTIALETEINPLVSITATKTEVTKDSTVAVQASLVNAHGGVSYRWFDSTASHNWQAITGAAAQTINYKPGNTGDKIHCVAQTATNCGDTVTVQSEPIAFKVNAVTGINPVSAGNYGITSWPNPAYTYMIIDGLRLSDQWQQLEVLDVDGRQKIMAQNITGQTQVTLNTNQLKAGVYFVLLRKKNGEMVYIKFVKL